MFISVFNTNSRSITTNKLLFFFKKRRGRNDYLNTCTQLSGQFSVELTCFHVFVCIRKSIISEHSYVSFSVLVDSIRLCVVSYCAYRYALFHFIYEQPQQYKYSELKRKKTAINLVTVIRTNNKSFILQY